MNRRQRRLKKKRAQFHSSPLGRKPDARIAALEEATEKARKARKGKAYIITQMNKLGYSLNPDDDHKEFGNYFRTPEPSLAPER